MTLLRLFPYVRLLEEALRQAGLVQQAQKDVADQLRLRLEEKTFGKDEVIDTLRAERDRLQQENTELLLKVLAMADAKATAMLQRPRSQPTPHQGPPPDDYLSLRAPVRRNEDGTIERGFRQ